MEKDMRTRTTAIILLVLLAAAGTVFASGENEEKSFSSPGIESVYVKAEFLDVQVEAGERFSVSMNAQLPGDSLFGSRNYMVEHQTAGTRLNVWIERESPFVHGARGGKLVFKVPSDVRLRIETASGGIAVNGMNSSTCSLSSISGRISVREARGECDASSTSGSISLDSAEGQITAKTVTGAISGRDISFTEDASFTTVSGNIDMRMTTSVEDLQFDLTSLSGRIIVGNIRANRGLRMGSYGVLIRGKSVSGALMFR
jgi:hypothetical protein